MLWPIHARLQVSFEEIQELNFLGSGAVGCVYGNFDIVLNRFSSVSQRYTTPQPPPPE